MKNNKQNIFRKTTLLLLGIVAASFFVGCVGDELFRDDLADSNSVEDTVFPEANFSYASTLEDFRTINFTNLSTEASTFVWDFGGDTSTEQDPTYTFADGEGTYSVTLTASDGNGVTGTTTIEVLVVEGPFQPIILEPGFEDDTLPGGGGDGRDSWRNSDLGGVIQITGSPVTFGDQGAKLPNDQSRIGYQEITVEPDTNYDLRFYYTMLDNATDPWLTVAILGITENGAPTTTEEALDATIASVTVNDTEDPQVYAQSTLAFNSGINNTVAIYFYNGPVEARLDEFTIDIGADGAVPPSVGFSSVQSETNYLEYTFENSSTGATSYMWDFGDGNTSTEESPTHVYDIHNIYTVTLTATNDANLSATLSQTIDIQAPVTADFTYQVDAEDYRTYAFMDASVDAVMLLWEFGDGFQFTGMNPTHTYDQDGIYTVTLTATSITGSISVATAEIVVAQGFIVQVLNGNFDLYGTTPGCNGESTGDNADAWDMTPNSTIKDCDGNDIPSPYDPLWDNGALDSWLEGFYGDNSEQAGSTSEGNNGTRGAKLDEPGRRLYQVVTVQQGETYNFSIDVKGDSEGLTPEVFILNTEIEDETGINASTSDPAIDAYLEIPATTSYDTYTFNFTASAGEIVIYVRNVDGSVRIDNIEITE